VRFTPGETATIETVVRTPALDGSEGLALSPDGAWLAYSSTITGRSEIWVQPYPGPGTPVRLSPNGGRVPDWARGGEELYYVSPDGLMAAAVRRGSTIGPASPTMLTDGVSVGVPWGLTRHDVGDGRILAIKPTGPQPGTSPINLVLNWMELVKRRE
jgi:hypothetical protein